MAGKTGYDINDNHSDEDDNDDDDTAATNLLRHRDSFSIDESQYLVVVHH